MDASRTLRRPSHDARRSYSNNGKDKESRPDDESRKSSNPQNSSVSMTASYIPGTDSSAAVESFDESNVSASQILGRSDVFRTPLVHSPAVAEPDPSDSVARHSHDTTHSSSNGKANSHSQGLSLPRHRSSRANNQSAFGHPDMEYESEAQQMNSRLSTSSSALQHIASYPLQKASGLAGFLRTRSKRMSGLLATESMGYYEKVSGMLAGGRKHYNTEDGLEPNDQVHGSEEDEDTAKAAEHFREHFAFPESEQLQSSFFASLQRILPNYGKIYISGRYFCFRSLMPTSKTKVPYSLLSEVTLDSLT